MKAVTGGSRLRWPVAIGGGVWLACVSATVLTGLGGALAQSALALVAEVFAVAVVTARSLRPGADQAGWRALAIAMGTWTTGELIRTILYLDGPRPSPSL